MLLRALCLSLLLAASVHGDSPDSVVVTRRVTAEVVVLATPATPPAEPCFAPNQTDVSSGGGGGCGGVDIEDVSLVYSEWNSTADAVAGAEETSGVGLGERGEALLHAASPSPPADVEEWSDDSLFESDVKASYESLGDSLLADPSRARVVDNDATVTLGGTPLKADASVPPDSLLLRDDSFDMSTQAGRDAVHSRLSGDDEDLLAGMAVDESVVESVRTPRCAYDTGPNGEQVWDPSCPFPEGTQLGTVAIKRFRSKPVSRTPSVSRFPSAAAAPRSQSGHSVSGDRFAGPAEKAPRSQDFSAGPAEMAPRRSVSPTTTLSSPDFLEKAVWMVWLGSVVVLTGIVLHSFRWAIHLSA